MLHSENHILYIGNHILHVQDEILRLQNYLLHFQEAKLTFQALYKYFTGTILCAETILITTTNTHSKQINLLENLKS